jgi:hypothetical protein
MNVTLTSKFHAPNILTLLYFLPAANLKGVLPLQDWHAGSTDSAEWGYSSRPMPSGSQMVAGSSQFHAVIKNDYMALQPRRQISSYSPLRTSSPTKRFLEDVQIAQQQ